MSFLMPARLATLSISSNLKHLPKTVSNFQQFLGTVNNFEQLSATFGFANVMIQHL
jgi:hypothetical protein